jgi:hypothetical protein
MKYLKFYKDCMATRRMPKKHKGGNVGGLCGNFGTEVMDIFEPTWEDQLNYNVSIGGYFGIDPHEMYNGGSVATKFTDTRQNMVLLLAAMNGEL